MPSLQELRELCAFLGSLLSRLESTGVCAPGLRNEISAATTVRGFLLFFWFHEKRPASLTFFLRGIFSLFVLECFVQERGERVSNETVECLFVLLGVEIHWSHKSTDLFALHSLDLFILLWPGQLRHV